MLQKLFSILLGSNGYLFWKVLALTLFSIAIDCLLKFHNGISNGADVPTGGHASSQHSPKSQHGDVYGPGLSRFTE